MLYLGWLLSTVYIFSMLLHCICTITAPAWSEEWRPVSLSKGERHSLYITDCLITLHPTRKLVLSILDLLARVYWWSWHCLLSMIRIFSNISSHSINTSSFVKLMPFSQVREALVIDFMRFLSLMIRRVNPIHKLHTVLGPSCICYILSGIV